MNLNSFKIFVNLKKLKIVNNLIRMTIKRHSKNIKKMKLKIGSKTMKALQEFCTEGVGSLILFIVLSETFTSTETGKWSKLHKMHTKQHWLHIMDSYSKKLLVSP